MNSYGQRFKTTEQRFFEKVNVVDDEQCWEWIGAKTPTGYGEFFVKTNKDGKASVTFYTTDASTLLKVQLEGLSYEGEPTVGKVQFEVR